MRTEAMTRAETLREAHLWYGWETVSMLGEHASDEHDGLRREWREEDLKEAVRQINVGSHAGRIG